MTKEELWKAYVARNPKWEDEEYQMKMSAGMLRKLMGSAFDAGWNHHKKIGETLLDSLKGAGIDLNKWSK